MAMIFHFILKKHGTQGKSGKPGVSDKYSLKISPENNMLNPRVGWAFISGEFFLGRAQYNIFMSVTKKHRWALTPISVISDIGLSLISELPISD
jgi:hypothetical protein